MHSPAVSVRRNSGFLGVVLLVLAAVLASVDSGSPSEPSEILESVDFVADTGDGFLPTFSVFAGVAQPFLNVSSFVLPRAKNLVIGGDLIYPHPTVENFDARLYGPMMASLHWKAVDLGEIEKKGEPMVEWFNPGLYQTFFRHLLRTNDPLSRSTARLRESPSHGQEGRKIYPFPPEFPVATAPTLWAIPGNHDVLDGLYTFDVRILEANYLAAWRLVQKGYHFALSFGSNWKIIGVHDQHMGLGSILTSIGSSTRSCPICRGMAPISS